MKTKFSVLTFALLLVLCSLVRAQQDQTHDTSNPEDIWPQNSEWVNGWSAGYWVTCTSGLSCAVTKGTCFDSSATRHAYAGGTISVTNATNYIDLKDSDCSIEISTSAYQSRKHLATVVASAGTVSSVTDDRGWFTTPAPTYVVEINGTILTAGDTINFNDSTPAAAANGLNVKWQKSTSAGVDNVSAYVQGDGNATHCFLGNGTFGACPGSGGGISVAEYRVCTLAFGTNTGPALLNADISPQVSNRCYVPALSTIVEIMVSANDGTPSISVAKNHLGSDTNLTSSALATAATGGRACSNTGGTTALDGSTTCSSTLTTTTVAAGDYLEPNGGTAGGLASAFVASITYLTTSTTHVCPMSFGANNAPASLLSADLSPQIAQRCYLPAGSTILEIMVTADAGTPSITVAKNHLGSDTNLTSSSLATAGSGGRACANIGGTTSIDGSTTCSAILTTTAISAGDFLEPNGGSPSTANAFSVSIVYTTP